MKVEELLSEVHDTVSIHNVYDKPYEQDGITIIAAASVQGGGGGGTGESHAADKTQETDSGVGGGFGLRLKPAGAFIIKDDDVRWQPAIDVNRLVLGGQIVAIVALLTLRAAIKKSR